MKFILKNVYDNLSCKRRKPLSALPVSASQMNGQNEQQQQQPANHSPDNAETVRYLNPFSHPEMNVFPHFIEGGAEILSSCISGQ